MKLLGNKRYKLEFAVPCAERRGGAQVSKVAAQHRTMIEAVENHMPEVVIVVSRELPPGVAPEPFHSHHAQLVIHLTDMDPQFV